LYRYSDETRSELFDIFNLLNDRIWVPHQVASEYLVNRIGVIGQQVKLYDDAIKNVDELRRSFENPKQHPFISGETLVEVVGAFDRAVSDLAANKKLYLSKVEDDDVKDQLEHLLDGCVGSALSAQDQADVLVAGSLRYAQKIPPGYKDAKKGGDSELISDKLKPFGDYIVWRQTLEKAKSSNQPVIFVTGDSKEDWWTIYSGRPIEPHPQLVDEFVREVGERFFMYLPETFMTKANEFLNRVTSQSAIDEIVDARAEEVESENFKSRKFFSDISRKTLTLTPTAEYQKYVLSSERDALEVQMIEMQSQMNKLEGKIEAITYSIKDVQGRYNVSMKSSNGVESAHSARLANVVRDMGTDLLAAKMEFEAVEQSYSAMYLHLSELRWEIEAITGAEPPR
jgi:flagellar motility protein MotE (MotC chaperone)